MIPERTGESVSQAETEPVQQTSARRADGQPESISAREFECRADHNADSESEGADSGTAQIAVWVLNPGCNPVARVCGCSGGI